MMTEGLQQHKAKWK